MPTKTRSAKTALTSPALTSSALNSLAPVADAPVANAPAPRSTKTAAKPSTAARPKAIAPTAISSPKPPAKAAPSAPAKSAGKAPNQPAQEALKTAAPEAKGKVAKADAAKTGSAGTDVSEEAGTAKVAAAKVAAAKSATTKPVAAKPVAVKPVAAAKTETKPAAAKAAAPAKPAPAKPVPTKPVPAKPVATSAAAAAFFAARQKMAPASSVDPHATSKGTVHVADKKVRKTLDDDNAKADTTSVQTPAAKPVTAAAAPAAPAPAPAPAPSVMPGRPFSSAPRGPMAIRPRPPVGGKVPTFKTGEYIVYPAHGVGQITAVETQEVAGYKLELFVISFIKDKMILKVPLPKIASVGMRKLAEAPVMKRALDTLTGRARVKRTMWSRRAQEYEAKINSGDLVAIAEVVRDLYRSDAQPEQSYSERQLYEAALDRMARELSAVQKLTDTEALKIIDDQLQKGPRRGKAEEIEADGDDEGDESGIGEAA